MSEILVFMFSLKSRYYKILMSQSKPFRLNTIDHDMYTNILFFSISLSLGGINKKGNYAY